uniref:Uncharacterized protein n=1 Tax=Timema cristinae TaxID=61476 RepID=A0A7R9DP11_TIMCR|nr:unnamed protein product [Timema cristinae]
MSALMPLLIAQGGTASSPQGPYPQMAPEQEAPLQIPYPYPYPYHDPGQYDQLDETVPAQGGEEQMEGGTGQMRRGSRQMEEEDTERPEQNNSETEITYNK